MILETHLELDINIRLSFDKQLSEVRASAVRVGNAFRKFNGHVSASFFFFVAAGQYLIEMLTEDTGDPIVFHFH